MFYQQENKEFTTCMDEFFIYEYYNYKNYTNKIKEECVNLINEISKIKLQTYEREQPKQISDTGNSLFNDSIDFKILALSNLFSSYAETDESEKDEIIRQIKLYFNIDIEPNFFFVGNLKEEKKMQIFGQYSYDYHGTKEEKFKNEMINQLKYNLLVYETILKFVENLNMCSVLPIVIKNVGEVLDKNITVKLYIDKTSVKTYQVSDYPVDDYTKAALWMFCEEDNIISSIFKFRSDSEVLAETKMNFNFRQPNIWGESKYNLDDFYNELKMYITEISHEDEDYYIIEFEIKDIRASEIKFLDRLILLYPLENDLELKYRIISDHSDGSNEGILKLRKRKPVEK